MKYLYALVLILLLPVAASAEVYRWIETDQTIHLSSIRPEWWTDEMDMIEDWHQIHPPTDAEREAAKHEAKREEKTEVSEEEAQLIADRKSKLFHTLDCRLIKSRSGTHKYKIDEANRVFFRSAADAEAEGFKPCSRCKANQTE